MYSAPKFTKKHPALVNGSLAMPACIQVIKYFSLNNLLFYSE